MPVAESGGGDAFLCLLMGSETGPWLLWVLYLLARNGTLESLLSDVAARSAQRPDHLYLDQDTPRGEPSGCQWVTMLKVTDNHPVLTGFLQADSQLALSDHRADKHMKDNVSEISIK